MLSRLFWIALVLYVVLRGALYHAQYRGSASPELRKLALRHFSAEDIAGGFEYSRRGFGARLAAAALDLALLLVLLQSGLAASLSDRLSALVGGRPLLHAVGFVLALVLGFSLLHLPLEWYLGHVLEKRFGFSTLTLPGWLLLQAKSLLVFLGVAALGALLWFALLRALPRFWPWVVPGAFALFQTALVLVMPLVLLPIFYRASPLPAGGFRERVLEVLGKAGIGVREIYVIDESRYSRHTNAFFAGLGPTKNIYLYDTLLRDHPPEEAITVVAHEAGHWRGRHVVKGLLLGFLGLAAGSFLLWALYPRLAGALGWRPLADPASLPALGLLFLLGGFVSSPLESAVSRSFEREADRAAVDLTGDPRACVEAEKRLVRTNRAQLLPHPWVVFWYYSHPPPLERIQAAEGR